MDHGTTDPTPANDPLVVDAREKKDAALRPLLATAASSSSLVSTVSQQQQNEPKSAQSVPILEEEFSLINPSSGGEHVSIVELDAGRRLCRLVVDLKDGAAAGTGKGRRQGQGPTNSKLKMVVRIDFPGGYPDKNPPNFTIELKESDGSGVEEVEIEEQVLAVSRLTCIIRINPSQCY